MADSHVSGGAALRPADRALVIDGPINGVSFRAYVEQVLVPTLNPGDIVVTDILNGKRGVSPETAMRRARYFGNSPRFWLNLQTTYELEVAEAELGERIAAEVGRAIA